MTPTIAPTSEASPSGPAEPDALGVAAWFLLDSGDGPTLVPVQRRIPRAPATGSATMTSLLAGPRQKETGQGITSAIPSGVALLSLDIDEGLATVDLSADFADGGPDNALLRRVAQVVYTLTQYPSVSKVRFELDGQAWPAPTDAAPSADTVSRDDYLAELPPIAVESPRWGQAIHPSFHVTGTADVFEATFIVQLQTPDGTLLASQQVMADCGSGCRGGFDATLSYPAGHAGPAVLIAIDLSEMDGSIEYQRAYRVIIPAG